MKIFLTNVKIIKKLFNSSMYFETQGECIDFIQSLHGKKVKKITYLFKPFILYANGKKYKTKFPLSIFDAIRDLKYHNNAKKM